MANIRFDKVAFGYTNMLFENATFSILDYDRIGIVGNNGSGKSTLLQCIAGVIEPQEGRIFRSKGLKFGVVEQDICKRLYDINLYDVLSDAIPADEKHHMAWRIDATLDAFKAPIAIRQKPVKELSGGWQRLALIARAVLSTPDILLLDEPTNHLDLTKILVLEQWLNEQVYDIPIVTISHDRNFLANCTNKTLFLRGTQLREYSYSYERALLLLKEDDNVSAVQRTKEMKEINRLKKSAHELRQIGVNNYSATALKKSIQIAKRAEGIETQLTQVHVEANRAIKLSNSGIQSKKIIELNHIDITTPDGTFLFHIDKLELLNGDRVIIFGKNGSGKSQLLKYIHRACCDINAARANQVIISPTIKLGYIDQHMSHLPLETRLHDYFDEVFSLGLQKTISVLVNAGFSVANQQAKLASLSQGQRARIAFLTLHLMQPNFYVMDEPTNHLDIAGQEQLEAEILEKNAASIIVSHDRCFTENIGTKFYVINNNKLQKIESPESYYANA